MKILPRIENHLGSEFTTRGGRWLLGLLALVAIEFLGRYAETDLADGVIVAISIFLVVLFVRDSRGTARRVMRRARQQMHQALVRLVENWLAIEADLRGQPRLERGLPRAQVLPAILVSLPLPALAVLGRTSASGFRDPLADLVYVVYIVLLAASWAAMLATIVVLVYASITFAREAFGQRRPFGTWAIPIWVWPSAMVIITLYGFFQLPHWSALILAVIGFLASAAVLLAPGTPRLDLVWRTEDGNRRGADWTSFFILHSALVILVPMLIAMLGSSPAIMRGWGAPIFHTMPVTGVCAVLLAWVTAAWALTWAAAVTALVVSGRREDPARPVPLRLHLRDEGSQLDDSRIEAALGQTGWLYRRQAGESRPGEVSLLFGERTEPGSYRWQPDWPLCVGPSDLEDPDLHARVRRRDEHQRRRALMRGLKRIFKSVPRASLGEGEGLLLGPQHWFFSGLTRDEGRDRLNEEELQIRQETIGPDFRDVMPLAARSHFFAVMRGLEIDLIYLERGVRYAQLRRVMRILFDVHDMGGGQRPLNERDLHGVPGLRAVIHGFDFEDPFRSELYPEPSYESIGRARILHLFRDRGDDSVRDELPREFFDLPLPVPMGAGV
jgi:hypothetical protein